VAPVLTRDCARTRPTRLALSREAVKALGDDTMRVAAVLT
jgi:hypothetical protein